MNTPLITEEARDNIKQLAEYLKLQAGLMDHNQKSGFNMAHYFNEENVQHVCGTSACAVGHYGIMIGGVPEEFGLRLPDKGIVGWVNLCDGFIGISARGETGDVWDWLFSDRWHLTDNTLLGAVARIEYFLEYGLPVLFLKYNGNVGARYGKKIVGLYQEAMEIT